MVLLLAAAAISAACVALSALQQFMWQVDITGVAHIAWIAMIKAVMTC